MSLGMNELASIYKRLIEHILTNFNFKFILLVYTKHNLEEFKPVLFWKNDPGSLPSGSPRSSDVSINLYLMKLVVHSKTFYPSIPLNWASMKSAISTLETVRWRPLSLA